MWSSQQIAIESNERFIFQSFSSVLETSVLPLLRVARVHLYQHFATILVAIIAKQIDNTVDLTIVDSARYTFERLHTCIV